MKGPLCLFVSKAKNSKSGKVLMGLGEALEGTGQAGTTVIGERQTAGGVCACLCTACSCTVFQPLDSSQIVTSPLSLSHTNTQQEGL